WLGPRAIPRPSQTRATRAAAAERGTGPGDAGEGEAADLRDAAAERPARHPDAGRRETEDDRPADPSDACPGDGRVPGRVRHLRPAAAGGSTPHTVCHAAGEFARDLHFP